MASNTSDTLSELRKSYNFHRVMTLHFDFGAETVRHLIDDKLTSKGMSLKDHLKSYKSKLLDLFNKQVIKKNHWQILWTKEPTLSTMDVSLLTILVINTFTSLSDVQKKGVINLRKKRNSMAHIAKGELNDNIVYNETSRVILEVAQSISNTFYEHIKQCVFELEKRELIICRSNLELVQNKHEELMVKLVETSSTEQVLLVKENRKMNLSRTTVLPQVTDILSLIKFLERAGHKRTTLSVRVNSTSQIRLGMTKWVRQLSRKLDFGNFLRNLKDRSVITYTEMKEIEQMYNYEEQANLLVLRMVNEPDESVLQFCKCLRECNPDLADLIENNPTDGKETDNALQVVLIEKIQALLEANIQVDGKTSIACEDVHIFIEERMGWSLKFTAVEKCVIDTFHCPKLEKGASRFEGLSWKIERPALSAAISNTPKEEIKADMPCEEFADYVCKEMEKLRLGLGEKIQTALISESISSKVFIKMTDIEMKETFSEYLGDIKYGIGISKAMLEVQGKFRQIQNKLSNAENELILRPFDSPTGNIVYSKCNVRPLTGNFLVPAHEYVALPGHKLDVPCLVKEVTKFVAACLNGRKNGTIHFGIKATGKGSGTIVGIETDQHVDTRCLNCQIVKGIEDCFDQPHVCIAKRCVRPIQEIRIDDHNIILEVDVVPFSGHIGDEMFEILYPPKGLQRREFFVYEASPSCDILRILPAKVDEVKRSYSTLIEQRCNLEKESNHSFDKNINLHKQLVKLLTCGNEYVTDEFIPIICSGNISGCPNENQIRKQVEMHAAFTSSIAVFDFDSSISLRNSIEKDKTSFHVKKAEDFEKDSELTSDERIWVYCNGNDELSLERMDSENWYNKRLEKVKNAMYRCRKLIPDKRALVIFLVFEKSVERDPMFEIARECMLFTFKGECVIIAENDEQLRHWKKEMTGLLGHANVDRYFHTGLTWSRITRIMGTVFRINPDVVCKLPNSMGHFVEMTSKERDEQAFDDIEILSGDQCKPEEEKMSHAETKENNSDHEKKFYKGNAVSWWNFYYKTHVGERKQFRDHRNDIESKLSSNKGESLLEIHEIQHRPGAGGSTLGMHLLWYFSQFASRDTSKAYRCCVVHTITENTITEMERFQSFKDEDAKPFLILVDNKSEESVCLLKFKLNELAYKTGSPGKLFCLIIVIKRVSMSHDPPRGKHILEHNLTKQEQVWFEKKYEELEEKGDVDVKTLIAFNVMRKSFDETYISDITRRILKDVEKHEMQLLKCLALINTYENDNPVPQSVFDSIMTGSDPNSSEINIALCIGKAPFGIMHAMRERQQLVSRERETWNVYMTESLRLLITKRKDDFYNSGVCIISRLMAQAILKYIMNEDCLNLEEIVQYVLRIVRKHTKAVDAMSKQFVKVVNSLFKTRQLLDGEKGETKTKKFSDLVLELERPVDGETEVNAYQRVVRVMKTCFDYTKDAMVGQQLARFNIHIKEYGPAEEAIKLSLEQKPRSSYLLDTYGQIHKANMETSIEQKNKLHGKIKDEDAAEIVNLAFCALDKFKDAQKLAQTEEDINLGCFHMEVKTALTLLEKFDRFRCYSDRGHFLKFLNDTGYSEETSDLKALAHKTKFKEFQYGSRTQHHLQTSLRYCEERNYQVKDHLYTIHTESNEVLLLKLRERFESFYGNSHQTSKLQFSYGIGLKPLMIAKVKDNAKLLRRVDEARINLEDSYSLRQADQRDLLVYLGYTIINISSKGNGQVNNGEIQPDAYKRLLQYSDRLVEIQLAAPRPYLEAFLYQAILHWPAKSRSHIPSLCHPKGYENMLNEWNKAYKNNFGIEGTDEISKNKPKNYFALGKGPAGNDIVDLESIRRQWRNMKKEEGRMRRPVYRDNFWREPFVKEKLQRLDGIVDVAGRIILHKAECDQNVHEFRIKTYYPCPALSNRAVTFVLGFSWRGLTAFDVDDKGSESNSPRLEPQSENFPSLDEDLNDPVMQENASNQISPEILDGAQGHEDIYRPSRSSCDCMTTSAVIPDTAKDVSPMSELASRQETGLAEACGSHTNVEASVEACGSNTNVEACGSNTNVEASSSAKKKKRKKKNRKKTKE